MDETRPLYKQFDSVEEIAEFAQFAAIPEQLMIYKYEEAKAKGLICVFTFDDTPEMRKILHQWRNR